MINKFLDPNPSRGTAAEWTMWLGELIQSLSKYTAIRFNSTSFFIEDHLDGAASVCNCVDIRGVMAPAFELPPKGGGGRG